MVSDRKFDLYDTLMRSKEGQFIIIAVKRIYI